MQGRCLFRNSKTKTQRFKKIVYHDIAFEIKSKELHRRGRPSKDSGSNIEGYEYIVEIKSTQNEISIERAIDENCCFVLCSNDLEINGETLLREYKTQDSVEKKFQ